MTLEKSAALRVCIHLRLLETLVRDPAKIRPFSRPRVSPGGPGRHVAGNSGHDPKIYVAWKIKRVYLVKGDLCPRRSASAVAKAWGSERSRRREDQFLDRRAVGLKPRYALDSKGNSLCLTMRSGAALFFGLGETVLQFLPGGAVEPELEDPNESLLPELYIHLWVHDVALYKIIFRRGGGSLSESKCVSQWKGQKVALQLASKLQLPQTYNKSVSDGRLFTFSFSLSENKSSDPFPEIESVRARHRQNRRHVTRRCPLRGSTRPAFPQPPCSPHSPTSSRPTTSRTQRTTLW